MAGKIEAKLAALGIVLPTPAAPIANYIPFNISGKLVVVSGQVPVRDGKIAYTGKLGAGVSIETGREAARLCFINLLAQLKAAAGDLDNVTRVVRLGGFIAAPADFTQHALVMMALPIWRWKYLARLAAMQGPPSACHPCPVMRRWKWKGCLKSLDLNRPFSFPRGYSPNLLAYAAGNSSSLPFGPRLSSAFPWQ
jgi:enamine deaminase RidA (YjgF/YER057c/UK114 family)